MWFKKVTLIGGFFFGDVCPDQIFDISLFVGYAVQLGEDVRITRDRGKWFERKGVWMMPTYHPSALLRDQSKKREAWEDMQSLRDKLLELQLYQDIYGA